MKLLKKIKEFKVTHKTRVFLTQLLFLTMGAIIGLNYIINKAEPSNMSLALLIMGVFFALDINRK